MIILANDIHHPSPVGRLLFEKDYNFIGKSKSLPHVTHNQSRKFWCNAKSDFRRGKSSVSVWGMVKDKSSKTSAVHTLASKKELGNIVTPLNDFG
jgi:predicted rRNA methylase YqxC with S4 and FtsJ domains